MDQCDSSPQWVWGTKGGFARLTTDPRHNQEPASTVDYTLEVRANKPIHVTNERFLSITVDVGILNKNWGNFSFGSSKLKTLTSALSPAYLRLSGTAADYLVFKRHCDDEVTTGQVDPFSQRPLTFLCPEDWDGINHFCSDTGLKLIFGLNQLLRTDDGQWDPTNAKQLLDYNTYDDVAWELGNEPNSYLKKANVSISGQQIGRGFNVLRSILQSRPQYSGASLFGPDIGGITKRKKVKSILAGFLSTTNATNATTFHSYYLNGRTATVDDFLNPETLDSLLPVKIRTVTSQVRKYHGKDAKVWLGESGSALGGGAPNISDRYVAGFLFLDKLGMCAKMGLDVVIRQSYYGGSYTMLDLVSLEPKPDYWSAYIYKYLVGPTVLHVKLDTISYEYDGGGPAKSETDKQYLRVYAHCTAAGKSGYRAGAVTLIILNMNKVNWANITLLRKLSGRTVDQYLLTPREHMDMSSSQVNLNGHPFQLVNDTTLPQLEPLAIGRDDPILIPPLSYGFYVVKVKTKACM
ncbi:heparanase-like [Asterias rubens]|uniref:heparanase-like n=1 Tax=Asterias rubens TaxID=7604 RepID=UPI001455CF14|nr:heparanase-like [Asterias rubens]